MKQEKYLYEELVKYAEGGTYPFHMPGHKRNTGLLRGMDPYRIDITEIEGFDNLHHAEGILKDAENRAAELFGAEETSFLVGGSTAGILSALSACAPKGGRLLMARNCHASVYHAAELRDLEPVYLNPVFNGEYGICGSVRPEDVEELLASAKAAGGAIDAVCVTSPTYDGVVSDIGAIAAITKRYGIPLIVDEAHGAHFAFHEYFPDSALRLGADVVIQSAHKTLPSLTQTALLHVQGNLADREKIRHYARVYQSSSPSYVLMGSLDRCSALLRGERGRELFNRYVGRLDTLRETLSGIEGLKLADAGDEGFYDYDRSKLLLAFRGMSGRELYQKLLMDYNLQLEMAAPLYALAMTSVCDTSAGFGRMERAFYALAESEGGRAEPPETMIFRLMTSDLKKIPDRALTPGEAMEREGREIPLEESAGHVCGAYIFLYPPGIPMLVPGERVTEEHIRALTNYERMGLNIQGIVSDRDYDGSYRGIRVLV